MSDVIEYLEQRDDVEKTEYSRVDNTKMRRVDVEMWHDAEGLHKIFEKARTGDFSERGLMDKAEEVSLAVRTTEVDGLTYLKSGNADDNEYKYTVGSSE